MKINKPRPLKLFISYSHKDEGRLLSLQKHLVTLKSKNILSEWSDKELIAGDDLDKEILENLMDADLVAFLVSIEFLTSWYCWKVELAKTLERMENDNVRIIPIIVGACKWQDTILGKYKAATKNGKSIHKYDDENEGWVEVVESIETAANKFLEVEQNKSYQVSMEETLKLNSKFIETLGDTEIVFQHKNKDRIYLDDLFIYPDLKNLKQEFDEIKLKFNSDKLVDLDNVDDKILILGGEQSGKTALAKMIYKSYFDQGYLPLFVEGQRIKDTNVEELFGKLLAEQYADLTYEDFIKNKSVKILIADDYSKLKINTRFHRKFLDKCWGMVDRLILFSDSSIKYDEPTFIELSDYSHYEITPLGNFLRASLVEKWISVGRKETIPIPELHNDCDRFVLHINSIIRNKVLPAKPIYILTIIQLLDTAQPSDYTLTSYGHCYNSLIQTRLKKSAIKVDELDTHINYLSEIAYYIFKQSSDAINKKQLADFKKHYSEQFLISSHEEILKGLLRAGILRSKDEGELYFGYRYIYYFYVGKYLADHIDSESCRKEIEHLCENIHTEINANILIFLVHHTKDQDIIDEIILHASMVFDGMEQAKLDIADTKYLMNYIESIPELVIKQRSVDRERKKQLKERDELDDAKEESSNVKPEDKSSNVTLAEINRSVRIIEVIGQILRNRHGSLTKAQLNDLAQSAYSSGLKFLNFFLSSTREREDDLLNLIDQIFKEDSSASTEDVSREARKIFLMLCYGTSYSIIKKISNSLGAKELIPIFEEISKNNKKSPAIQLIQIAIQLEFDKKIPKAEISKLFQELEGNPIGQRLLQELVIQHIYLNTVSYQDMQWISEKLKLPIQAQRQMQRVPK